MVERKDGERVFGMEQGAWCMGRKVNGLKALAWGKGEKVER